VASMVVTMPGEVPQVTEGRGCGVDVEFAVEVAPVSVTRRTIVLRRDPRRNL